MEQRIDIITNKITFGIQVEKESVKKVLADLSRDIPAFIKEGKLMCIGHYSKESDLECSLWVRPGAIDAVIVMNVSNIAQPNKNIIFPSGA